MLNFCCLCDGPIEDLNFNRTPDGELHHIDPRACVHWTERNTAEACVGIASGALEIGDDPADAIAAEFELPGFEPICPQAETMSEQTKNALGNLFAAAYRHLRVQQLAEMMRTDAAREWWIALEGK